MHELSIAMSIVDVAEEEAERQGGLQVEAIHLKLGPLSGIVKEALLAAYGLACENTSLEGSRLIIEEIPILVYCSKCQARRSIHSIQMFCCRDCDTPASEVVQGRELQVTALELRE